jgi:hypothetical protein
LSVFEVGRWRARDVLKACAKNHGARAAVGGSDLKVQILVIADDDRG